MTTGDNHYTVITLFVFLFILIVVLVYLYKKLNRDTDGKYTIHKIIYGKNGVRQRLQNGVGALENLLGIHLWPRKGEVAVQDDEEDLEDENQEDEKEISDIEQGQGLDAKCQADKKAEEDDSDDYSSMEGDYLRERANVVKENNADKVEETKKEEGGDGAVTSGAGLLVDLKQFSGSAIWQEEKNEGRVGGSDLTAL